MPTTTSVIPEGIPMQLEYKSAVTGSLLGHDDEKGIVEALVSITGIPDEQDDIVVPGAYKDTLGSRKMKGVRFHDWARPVAKTLVQEEWAPGDERLPKELPNGDPWPAEAGALYVKGQYNLAVQDGRDAYETAKFFGPDGQWSIGYRPAKGGARRDQKSGKRLLTKVDLFEWSDVLHGAAPLSTTLGVKTAGQPADDAGDVDEPEGFVDDQAVTGKEFDPSQARATDGQWTDTGSGGAAPAGAGPGQTGNGLPGNWLERVLAGDPKYVKPSGGGGKGGKKKPSDAATATEKERLAEDERRDRVDQALQDEQAAERKRRAAADAKIQSYTGGEHRRLQEEESSRRQAWQETFDAARDEERSRRRKWNAEQRRRKADEKRKKDEAGGGKSLGWDADLSGLDDGDTVDEKLFGSVEPAAGGPVDDVEVKVMDVLAGSFEERRERLRAAAEQVLGARRGSATDEGVYVYIVGTWNDRVVATRHGNGESQTFEIPYSIRDGEVEMGSAEEVEIVSTIQPSAGGNTTKSAAALVLDDAARMLALDSVGTKSAAGQWTDEDELLAGTLDRIGALVTGEPLELGGKSGGDEELETKTAGGEGEGDVDGGKPDGLEGKVAIDPDKIKEMLAVLA